MDKLQFLVLILLYATAYHYHINTTGMHKSSTVGLLFCRILFTLFLTESMHAFVTGLFAQCTNVHEYLGKTVVNL